MICRMAQLQYKEVIDIADGARYGFVDDLELDLDQGSIQSLVVRGQPRLLGLLGRESDCVFPWSAVKRLGEDIILVDGAGGGQRHRERVGR